MSSLLDTGTQLISFDFKQAAKGEGFNRLLRFLIKPGIVEGFGITNPSGNTIQVAPGHAVIDTSFDGTDSRQVHVQTQTAFNYAAVQKESTFDDYLITRYTIENFNEFINPEIIISSVMINKTMATTFF